MRDRHLGRKLGIVSSHLSAAIIYVFSQKFQRFLRYSSKIENDKMEFLLLMDTYLLRRTNPCEPPWRVLDTYPPIPDIEKPVAVGSRLVVEGVHIRN